MIQPNRPPSPTSLALASPAPLSGRDALTRFSESGGDVERIVDMANKRVRQPHADAQREQELELYREIRPQLGLASLGALLVGVAYLLLPETLTVGPNWLLLAIEVVVLLPLTVTAFIRPLPPRLARGMRTTLQVALTLALLSSLILLLVNLPDFQRGAQVLRPAALLWVSNILIFAVSYWELDGGGPAKRHIRGRQASDFLFPQYAVSTLASSSTPTSSSNPAQDHPTRSRRWMPGYVDYLFLAFCFATALSPADTAPLTPRAKLLMMAEALISLTIIVVLIGRSINIL
jgi:hypothetical protein